MKNVGSSRRSCLALVLFILILGLSCSKGTDPELPDPPPPYKLQDNTLVIPQDSTTVIQDYDTTSGTVSLDSSSTYAQGLSVGDVIIGQDDVEAPNGFLRKVTSKTMQGGSLVLETEQATMLEAFETMDISETHQLKPSDIKSSKFLHGTKLVTRKATDDGSTFSVELDCVFYDQDGKLNTTDDQIKLEGTYDFTADLHTEIDIDLLLRLKKFESWIEISQEVDIDVIASLKWEFDKAVEFDLAKFNLAPIPVGGLVWLVPTLTIEAHVHGDLTVTFETGIEYTQTVKSGIGYENKEFYVIKESTKDFTFTPPQFTAEFNFETGASLNASCLLYGLAGPYMGGKVGFHFEAILSVDPCTVDLTFDLEAIAYAVVGIECDILKLDYKKEYRLYTHPIGNWIFPLGGSGTIVIDAEPNSINAPWSMVGPCSYGTNGTGDKSLTELSPGNYTLTWDAVSGWTTPSNSTQALAANATVTFTGTYSYDVGTPEVTTASVTAITQTTATCGGNVTSDGGATVTARGVCWSTSPTPTVADSKTTNGTGTGSFISSITGLTAGTPYYVRAYATNSTGTGYGNVQTFTTTAPSGVPVLTTASVTAITQTTATCGGNVTSDGGATVTARGVCWSTNSTPTVADSKTTNGTGTGSFISSITGLTAGTPYYVRAYATNSTGTGYGNVQTFITTTPAGSDSTGTVTDYDGNVYQTIKIGDQWWMAKNLKVTHYRNGDPIPNVTGRSIWLGLTTGAYCEYNNDPVNVATYGRLYNWYAVDDSRNIAPEGWHIPTDEEWKQLEMYLGMSQAEADATDWRGTDEGGKLKETGTTHWTSPNTGATNESGFTALSGGYRGNNGNFESMGNLAYFWSSTKYDSNLAWFRNLHYYYSQVARYYNRKLHGFSVRCVRD